MPAFSALATFIATRLISIGVPHLLAQAGGSLIAGGAAAVASRVLSPKPRLSSPNGNYQAVINQAAAPRVRGYGRAKLGGPRAFFDSKKGKLYQIVLLHTGEVAGFHRIWVGDVAVTRDSEGLVENEEFLAGGGNHMVRVLTRTGTDDQTPYNVMLGAWPEVWSADHKINGIATMCAVFESPKLEYFQKVFPDGHNTQVRAELDLTKVYDPRTMTIAWSDNAALCIADYLVSDDGMPNIGFDDIDWDSFGAFADVCDQPTGKKGGGTEPRYRLWGVYSLQDEPKGVLERMAQTCDAELYLTPEGKIGVRGGVWTEPTVTIEDSIVTGYEGFEQGSGRFVAFNELKIIYTDPEQDYQPTEAEPWIDHEDQADRGQIVSPFDVDMVPSASQARRLAKIHSAKENPRWRGTVQTDLRGLAAVGERIVRIVLPELGIDGSFFIKGWSLASDMSGLTFDVISLSEDAYLWDAEAEEGQTSPPPADTSPDTTLPIPEFDDYVVELRDFTAGTSAPVIIAAFLPEPDRDDLTLQAQIRLSPDGPWEGMSIDDLTAISGPVVEDEDYDIRARWQTPSNAASEWSDPETVTASL